MDVDLVATGDRVRAARLKAGLSQRALQEQCALSQPTLQRLESGCAHEGESGGPRPPCGPDECHSPGPAVRLSGAGAGTGGCPHTRRHRGDQRTGPSR